MSDPKPDAETPAGLLPVQKLLPALYQDALQPGVKQLGVALESALSLVPTLMLPFRYVSERAKLLLASRLDDYRRRLASDHPGLGCTASLRITDIDRIRANVH